MCNCNVDDIRAIVHKWLVGNRLENVVAMGLPEYCQKSALWHVALTAYGERVGQVFVDSGKGIIESKTTDEAMVVDRILGRKQSEFFEVKPKKRKRVSSPAVSPLSNQILCGNNVEELSKLPDESINLVVTSPPYYNA